MCWTHVYGLLLAPDPGDSLDSKLALLAYNDLEAYKDMVKPSGEAVIKTRYQVPLSRPVIKTRYQDPLSRPVRIGF